MGLTHELPVNPSFVVPEKITQKVLVSEFDSGQEQRKLKWNNPKRSWRIHSDGLTAAELESLRDFSLARQGPFDVFMFLPPVNLDRLVKSVSCGTGNGTETVFTIQNSATPPYYFKVYLGAGTRNQAYVGGSPTAATFANDDANKKSTVTITPAPANGAVVTCDIDRYLICRFSENEFSLALEHYGIGSAEYEIVEVLRSSI